MVTGVIGCTSEAHAGGCEDVVEVFSLAWWCIEEEDPPGTVQVLLLLLLSLSGKSGNKCIGTLRR